MTTVTQQTIKKFLTSLFKKIILPVLCLCILSCTSMKPQAAPEWVNKLPQSDSLYEYFSATGTGCGTEAEQIARKHALNSIFMQLSRYLGSSIAINIQTTGLTETDKAQFEVQTSIQENATAYIDNCKVVETFIHPKEKNSTCISISLLVQYDKTALAAEQIRLNALRNEKEQAILLPEQEGDALAIAKKNYKALLRYIEAAYAAATSEIDNIDVKYQRNINKAQDMLKQIKIETIQMPPHTALVNQPFPAPFTVRLYATDADELGIAEVPILISYTAVNPKNGKKIVPLKKMLTNKNGIISFIHPVQNGSYENGMVVIALDIDTILLPLRKIPNRYKNSLKLLEEAAKLCQIKFLYKITDTAGN